MVSDKDPNSSTSVYSILLEKTSSPKSCVSAWKESYLSQPSTTTTSAATTQKTCVERWEIPCPRENGRTFPPVTTIRPPEREDFADKVKMIIPTINKIKMTVQNAISLTVSHSLTIHIM